MALTVEEVQAKVDKLEVNMSRLDSIVNASSTTDVVVDTGTVPSISKLIATIGNTASGYVTQSQTAANTAIAASMSSRLLSNQFTGVAVSSTTNLQIRSEEMDNAAYTKTNTSVTANAATAPDNTTTSDKVTETAVTGLFTLTPAAAITVTGGLKYTRSVWAKAVERSVIALILNQSPSSNNASAIFDLTNGVVVSTTGTGATAYIENWGNGYYRCALTTTVHASATATSGAFLQILSSTSDTISTSRLGVAGSGVHIWGAQFEQNSAAGPYAKTTTASATVSQYSAKHWADTAAGSISGVATFNGRSGAVVPGSSDYTATQIAYSGGTNVQAKLDAITTDLTTRATLTDVANAVPAGTSIEGFWNAIPTGYLEETGAAISRTTYAALFAKLVTDWGFTSQTFTVTIASPAVFTKTAHGFNGGERVRLSTTGALPTGLSNSVDYYVIYVDANTFRVATTQANFEAGTAVGTSGTQSGTHTYLQSLFGLGDGSTTFNIPDSRNTFSRTNPTSGQTIGSQWPSQNKLHTHGIDDPGHVHPVKGAASGSSAAAIARYSSGGGVTSVAGAATSATTGITINASGNAEGYPRHITRKRIIKY